MKNLMVVIILIFVLFSSCDMTVLDGNFWNINLPSKHEKIIKDELDTAQEIYDYVTFYVEYSSGERGKKDFWKTPQETWDNGYGDCEDRINLTLAILDKYKSRRGYLVIEYESGKEHAYMVVNGKSYGRIGYKNKDVYPFDEIPYVASVNR